MDEQAHRKALSRVDLFIEWSRRIFAICVMLGVLGLFAFLAYVAHTYEPPPDGRRVDPEAAYRTEVFDHPSNPDWTCMRFHRGETAGVACVPKPDGPE